MGKGIGRGLLPTSGLRLAPLALLSTLSLFILPAAQTGLSQANPGRLITDHPLDLVAGTADGLLLGPQLCGCCLFTSVLSVCYIGFFLTLCTQGLLGCLVDFLGKPSCAGGFRAAVEEARANLQSPATSQVEHSSAASWAETV